MSATDYALVPPGYQFEDDDTSSIIIDTPLGRFDFGDPLKGATPDTVAQSPLPQIFILDESGSMDKAVRDPVTGEHLGNRMLMVLDALNALIASQQKSSRCDRIFATVIALGDSVRVLRPFMPIRDMDTIAQQEIGFGNSTPLYQAELLSLTAAARFQEAFEAEAYEPTSPVITVLSDGGQNDGWFSHQVSLAEVDRAGAAASEELAPIHVAVGIALSSRDRQELTAFCDALRVEEELRKLDVREEDLPGLGDELRGLVDGASEKAENA